jgi:hypothetical protein
MVSYKYSRTAPKSSFKRGDILSYFVSRPYMALWRNNQLSNASAGYSMFSTKKSLKQTSTAFSSDSCLYSRLFISKNTSSGLYMSAPRTSNCGCHVSPCFAHSLVRLALYSSILVPICKSNNIVIIRELNITLKANYKTRKNNNIVYIHISEMCQRATIDKHSGAADKSIYLST